MKAPQVIILIIYVMKITFHLIKDGEPIKENYNFWSTLFGCLLGIAILAWGGFWG